MNAIVASYTSSDSEDDLRHDFMASTQNPRKQPSHSHSEDDLRHDSMASVQNPRKQQPSHSHSEDDSRHDSMASTQNPRKQPSHSEDHTGDVNLPVLSKQPHSLYASQSVRDQGISADDSQHTAGTINQGAMNSSVSSLKKDTVMPYIPKSKRTKFAGEIAGAVLSNTSPNLVSSVFKKAKIFSRNISHHYAPKRKLVRFDAHQGCINRISWNPCFQDFLLSASMDCAVKVWNVETTASCVLQVSGHTQAVKDVKWNIDGLKVLSCGYDKFSRITDINIGKEVSANKHNSFVTCVLFQPSDPNVYLSGTSNDGIFAWDVRTQQETISGDCISLNPGGPGHGLCYGKSGYDASNLGYKSFFGQIQDLAFLPDGQSFISAAEISRRNSTDKGIMVWDYNTSTVLSNQVFQEAYTCTALQIHPHDSSFLAQCNAGYIAVFSQKSPYKLNKYKRFEGHCVSSYHIGMHISPDGSLVASGSSDGSLYVYNYRTSDVIKTFVLDSQPCMDVAWSPSVPSLLASCDWNGKIFLHR